MKNVSSEEVNTGYAYKKEGYPAKVLSPYLFSQLVSNSSVTSTTGRITYSELCGLYFFRMFNRLLCTGCRTVF